MSESTLKELDSDRYYLNLLCNLATGSLGIKGSPMHDPASSKSAQISSHDNACACITSRPAIILASYFVVRVIRALAAAG
ncbi:unnamed protein product [Protopolystoma xenopodis]|uniref:Uncharacterized protein n=1 Tax=Protopolystoma xenopodis TaxID=117903 RepID=A0A448WBR0_9PLAT|nr:unnamed protein product [Protopolystoma xenopodis]